MSRANPNTTHDNAGIAAWRFNLSAEIGSFEDCRKAFFGADDSAKWREGFGIHDLVIGPQMYLRPTTWRTQAGIPTAYAVVLYDTEIIRYYVDGSFSVDNGGHNTPTTSERLNAVLPDGFRAYHQQKRLGLVGVRNRWATRAKPENQPAGVLWPLDHDTRINAKTGEIKER